MKKWLFLAAAIVTEVIGSLSMKASGTNPAWYALVVLGFLIAFYSLSQTLRHGMPLGVAYGLWGATGVALTAILATLIFGENFTPLMGLGLAIIMGGVLVVQIGSQKAIQKAAALGPDN
ncbi:SMR family transporter [Arthrobacter russicus]